ncbi:MAG: TniQ family protein [Lachnospiraceae bacterium]|jgi:hypothetical protein|nr:TniQ family protein [Lachnospiraceae bacterium]MCH4062940.1 TniQ family protein [Lachnospiraceae bacterium]MCH4104246.1 TniQ family protein [Lachnospiraceae bacterium]MCI1309093.1 TniQ family protein [Lachnospiraceae bacterium]MCI1356995.1 TniQ family protein [Lachnospiraceae bacterium]
MIPVTIQRETDELLYSWVLRLSDANGFRNVRSFVNAYITPNATPSEKARRVLKYDLLEDYENIFRALSLPVDKQELFLSSGMFPFYRLFLTREQQAAILDAAFRNNARSGSDVTKTRMISALRLCPQCMKEDTEKTGHFYYHRSHQLPGVTVCPEHGCALEEVRMVSMHELDPDPAAVPYKTGPESMPFARYAAALLREGPDGRAEGLKECLCREADVRYGRDGYAAFLRDYESRYGQTLPDWKRKASLFWKSAHSALYLDPVTMVYGLMLWFPDVRDLLERLPDAAAEPPEFDAALKRSGCQMLSPYAESVVELKHSCGHVFSISPAELMRQWACPVCSPCDAPENRETDARTGGEAMFRREIRDLTGSDYTLVSPYVDRTRKVSIRHNVCGHVQEYKPSAFLDGQRCRFCGQLRRMDQLEKAVDTLFRGQYRITARRTANLFTIQDREAGTSRDMTAARILQELTRPTPSPLLPMADGGQKELPAVPTEIAEIRRWISEHCPKGEPVFLEDVRPEGIPYAVIKSRVADLCKKRHVLEAVSPGIYRYPEDRFTPDEIVYFRYLMRNGRHIGYPVNRSALYALGIITDKPDSFAVVTNKETPSNLSGRTTTFMGHRLRIRGSAVPVTDDNWRVLMLLDTAVNLKKYLHGGDTEPGFRIMAAYVREHGITPDQFAPYQRHYAFAYSAVRRLFKTDEATDS